MRMPMLSAAGRALERRTHVAPARADDDLEGVQLRAVGARPRMRRRFLQHHQRARVVGREAQALGQLRVQLVGHLVVREPGARAEQLDAVAEALHGQRVGGGLPGARSCAQIELRELQPLGRLLDHLHPVIEDERSKMRVSRSASVI